MSYFQQRQSLPEMNSRMKDMIAECNHVFQITYSRERMVRATHELPLETLNGNRLVLQLFGATIDSLKFKNQELLFVSDHSIRDRTNAIRGGISLEFPILNQCNRNMAQMGFANKKRWSISRALEIKTDYSVTSILKLADDEETMSNWNHKFELIHTIVLRAENSIYIELTIQNKDDAESDFSSLIQAYFKLDDIRNVKLHGLKDTNYIDQLNGNDAKDTNDFIIINSETHLVYYDTTNEKILDTGNENNFKIKIETQNCPDMVVWNPWVEKSKEINDLGDNEYNKMIYIAVGHAKSRLILKPNESYTMSLELIVQNN